LPYLLSGLESSGAPSAGGQTSRPTWPRTSGLQGRRS